MGFPTRILRAALGPLLEAGPRAVRSHSREVGEDRYNLLEHTAVGSGLIVARAKLIAEWGTSSFSIDMQEEAWNTDHSQSHPALARTAAGSYTYTFAASYLDHLEVSHTLTLVGASASAMAEISAYADRVDAYAWIDSTDPSVIQIRLFDGSGTLVDERFLLEVY